MIEWQEGFWEYVNRHNHDAHVISWLVIHYWHVVVGEGGDWKFA